MMSEEREEGVGQKVTHSSPKSDSGKGEEWGGVKNPVSSADIICC